MAAAPVVFSLVAGEGGITDDSAQHRAYPVSYTHLDTALSSITGAAATSCFGVKGMAYRSMTDGLVHLLRREAMSKGVNVIYHEDESITIELHIIVENGVNIPAVCRSIMNEVRYVVNKNTGAEVRSVDVFVDSMIL